MIRWVESIEMFALDRDKHSCLYCTDFCKDACYNNKFYAMKNLDKRDVKNEKFWNTLTGKQLNKILASKRKSTKRFRLCTRGEPFKTLLDVTRIKDWCDANVNVKFEAPTRAWRNYMMKQYIEQFLFPVTNLYIHASLDPSNTQDEFNDLASSGWSTSFFGNDAKHPFTKRYIKCPMKWNNKGSCASCTLACFTHKQTHHWLKKH